MEMVKVEVSLPKENYELSKAMENTIIAARKALADGFQPGADLTAIGAAAFGELMVAVAGYDQMLSEARGKPGATLVCYALAVGNVLDASPNA